MKLFKNKGLYYLLGASFLLAGVILLVNVSLVYPRYKAQLINWSKKDALTLARHLSHEITDQTGEINEKKLKLWIKQRSRRVVNDFDLLKINIFDNKGKIIYSSNSSDIGKTAPQRYFYDIVAQGQPFTRLVKKDQRSVEGDILNQDVIETYAPIMMNTGNFAGAFEIYYEITNFKSALDQTFTASALLYPFLVISIFLGIIFVLLIRLDQKIIAQKNNQERLEEQQLKLFAEQEKQQELFGLVESAKRQWEMTIDCVEDMVMLTDADLRIRRCNNAVVHFSGINFNELLGQQVSDILDGIKIDKDNSPGERFEYFHAVSGKWFYVKIYSTRHGDQTEGFVIDLHDLTAIKKMTMELEEKNNEIVENRNHLQLALDNISELITRAAKEKSFKSDLSSNLSLEKYMEAFACGETDCPCCDKEKKSCLLVADILGHGQSPDVAEYKKNLCEQCPHYQDIMADPIFRINEQFNNLMQILTLKNQEVEQAYGELKQTQSQLLQQEKMASIGQLAAGVAHEINNPVGFISSNINSLGKYVDKLNKFVNLEEEIIDRYDREEAKTRISEERKKYKLDFIQEDIGELIKESLEGCERVKRIVQDLKSFSRVDQTGKQRADINECLDTTLNIIWNELKYKAEIKKDYAELPVIECFPQQLNQVFMNLLINAVHAIPEKGLITIKTYHKDGFVYILIEDNGSGIAPDHLEHIFEPFFTTKEVGKGTGLGLSIVYDIVTKNHHGDISVTSELGKGTIFRVKLPVENTENQNTA